MSTDMEPVSEDCCAADQSAAPLPPLLLETPDIGVTASAQPSVVPRSLPLQIFS